MTISFVGSNALAKELGRAGAGVFVTQVVPFPTDNIPRVGIAYRRALAAHMPEATPGFVSYEGYLAGRLAIAALARCGKEVDRTRFLTVCVAQMPLTSTALNFAMAKAIIRVQMLSFSP